MSEDAKSNKFFCRDNSRLVFLLGFFAGIAFWGLIALVIYSVLKIKKEEVNLIITEQNQVVKEAPQEIVAGINVKAITFSDQDHIKGRPEAKQILIVYMDFESAHSKQFYTPLNKFYQENQDKVKIVWRHFPLDFHARARSAAVAAECGGKQEKFWQYADKLFEQQEQLNDDLYLKIAEELGLDMPQFKNCLEDREITDLISLHLAEGVAVGISGAPQAVFLNEAEGTYEYIGGSVNESYLNTLLK